MSESCIVLLPGRSSVSEEEDRAIREQFPGEVIEYQRIDYKDTDECITLCKKHANVCILINQSVHVPPRALLEPELAHAIFVSESNRIERVKSITVTYETEPMSLKNTDHLVSG